jgi:hypothetical protein
MMTTAAIGGVNATQVMRDGHYLVPDADQIAADHLSANFALASKDTSRGALVSP